MIARLLIELPYLFAIPKGAGFPGVGFEIAPGYRAVLLPPIRSPSYREQIGEDLFETTVGVDGKPGFFANVLRIDFEKESFDRTDALLPTDPTPELLEEIANRFLERLRFVSGSEFIRAVDLSKTLWALRYLNDDGSRLPETEGLKREWFGKAFRVRVSALTPESYTQLTACDGPTPVWDEMLLDAKWMLPEVGPAIVLAHTALEVLIGHVIGLLAEPNPVVRPFKVWMDGLRPDRRPSVRALWSDLLAAFGGTSLKGRNDLWEKFCNLNDARNEFVHRGVAKIGGVDVTEEKAGELVSAAREIAEWVRLSLTPEIQWARPGVEIQMDIQMQLRQPEFGIDGAGI